MTRHAVCKLADVTVGKLTEVKVGRSTVVLSRLPSGEIRALSGRCPHQGAALGHGCIAGFVDAEVPNVLRMARDGEVLRCPWHGFEFSLIDGEPTVPSPAAMPMRLRFYPAEIVGEDIVVTT